MANRTASTGNPRTLRPPKGGKPSEPGRSDSQKEKAPLKRFDNLKQIQQEFYPEG